MYRLIKPILDILGACLFLLLFLIPILWISLLLYAMHGRVFYKQQRVGKAERIFWIYKFQTMTDARDEHGELLPDEQRITKLGNLLRKTSLDELPQCWNVLKGDMSFIGPRPLLVAYLELYSEEERKRHHVKPGLTGLAQMNGRNAISWQEKFAWDVRYVNHLSMRQDVHILIRTVKKVLLSEDIARDGYATTPPFEGSKK
ncbi:sugar transferase [Listeria booriae]|uniref:Sugar transferase n=1 Tax=Listeria booriae TaxID=1552123 RepID=A0A842AF45_9LIST|nr:sugar transferase [Listeria booriae]MBC1403195.1 sugar transferase [Listeria booriae]MBC1616513.1 sugar transferase [Listeria booriae]